MDILILQCQDILLAWFSELTINFGANCCSYFLILNSFLALCACRAPTRSSTRWPTVLAWCYLFTFSLKLSSYSNQHSSSLNYFLSISFPLHRPRLPPLLIFPPLTLLHLPDRLLPLSPLHLQCQRLWKRWSRDTKACSCDMLNTSGRPSSTAIVIIKTPPLKIQ